MANEAVTIELLGDRGNVVRFTCADAPAISGGTICKLVDPRTCSGSQTADKGVAFAGIAASDKVGGDGSTSHGLYTYGIFDLTMAPGGACTAGETVVISGQNLIDRASVAGDALSGAKVGKALETGSTGEVIAVLVGG
jgi:hypothetical protein